MEPLIIVAGSGSPPGRMNAESTPISVPLRLRENEAASVNPRVSITSVARRPAAGAVAPGGERTTDAWANWGAPPQR